MTLQMAGRPLHYTITAQGSAGAQPVMGKHMTLQMKGKEPAVHLTRVGTDTPQSVGCCRSAFQTYGAGA